MIYKCTASSSFYPSVLCFHNAVLLTSVLFAVSNCCMTPESIASLMTIVCGFCLCLRLLRSPRDAMNYTWLFWRTQGYYIILMGSKHTVVGSTAVVSLEIEVKEITVTSILLHSLALNSHAYCAWVICDDLVHSLISLCMAKHYINNHIINDDSLGWLVMHITIKYSD